MTVRLHVIGGLGFFGQNCMLVEDTVSGDVVLIDAGAGFPREPGGGHELMIADPSFLRPFADRLKGYLLTHGHEDHIGAVGYFNREAPAPVYGAPTTLALVRERCSDVELPMPDLHVLSPGEDIQLGAFHITALAVSHSIPDTLCLLVETAQVKLVHSGDFRVDDNPVVGPPTDMSGLSALAGKNIDLLLADSTGAVSDGHNPGERAVVPVLTKIFESSPRRIFLTTFASHVQRLQIVAELSSRFGRRILLAGRGAITHARVARDRGLAPWLDAITIHPSEALDTRPEALTVILSGCQGEEHSAFWRLSHGDGRLPPVQAYDTVVHSARAVPGNEGKVAALLDVCARKGARVVDGREGVHVSGHGYKDDMRQLCQAVKPRILMPVHGGFRHLHAMAELGQQEGLDEEMTPVCGNGDVLEIAPHAPPRVVNHMPVPSVLVDDDGELMDADELHGERRELLGGLVVVSASVDPATGQLKGAPRLSTRGLGGGALELLEKEGPHEAHVSFNALPVEERLDPEGVQMALARGVRRVLRRVPGRPPAVVAHAHVG